jgi:hypothetical protein
MTYIVSDNDPGTSDLLQTQIALPTKHLRREAAAGTTPRFAKNVLKTPRFGDDE